jgi:hypothetical protein
MENESARPPHSSSGRSESGNDTESRSGDSTLGNLKAVGIDTERMAGAAEERVTALQQMLMDEVRARPMRALAWAAGAGLVLGIWSAR